MPSITNNLLRCRWTMLDGTRMTLELEREGTWWLCGHLEYMDSYLNFRWDDAVNKKVFSPRLHRVLRTMAMPIEKAKPL